MMQMCEIEDLLQQPFALSLFLKGCQAVDFKTPLPLKQHFIGKKDIFSLFPGLTFHSFHWYSEDESLREPNNWNLQGTNCSFSTKYETRHAEL